MYVHLSPSPTVCNDDSEDQGNSSRRFASAHLAAQIFLSSMDLISLMHMRGAALARPSDSRYVRSLRNQPELTEAAAAAARYKSVPDRDRAGTHCCTDREMM